jgi:hypothetical protein
VVVIELGYTVALAFAQQDMAGPHVQHSLRATPLQAGQQ